MPGTGPSPSRLGPWQTAHWVVLPPPVVARVSPFLMLPGGGYALHPDLGFRRASVASVFSGASMMRCPMGSLPASAPSNTRNIPPAIRVFGTVSVSTTRIHGVHFIDEKYDAAALISSSVMAFAKAIILFVFPFLVSALFRRSFLKSIMVCTKYE